MIFTDTSSGTSSHVTFANTRVASASSSLFSKQIRLVVTPYYPLRLSVDITSGRVSLNWTVTAGDRCAKCRRMCQLVDVVVGAKRNLIGQ